MGAAAGCDLLSWRARDAIAAIAKLDDRDELEQLLNDEQDGKARVTVLRALERALERAGPPRRREEQPPADLPEELVAVWLDAQATLKRQGGWSIFARAQLDQLVAALESARIARKAAKATPFVQGSQGPDQLVPHPGFRVAEASEAKALALAKVLVLTPDAQARHGFKRDEGAQDPMEAILGAGG